MKARIALLGIEPTNVARKKLTGFIRMIPERADKTTLGITGIVRRNPNTSSSRGPRENFSRATSICAHETPRNLPHRSKNGFPKKKPNPYTNDDPIVIPKAAGKAILKINTLKKDAPDNPERKIKPDVTRTAADGIGANTSSITDAAITPRDPRGRTDVLRKMTTVSIMILLCTIIPKYRAQNPLKMQLEFF